MSVIEILQMVTWALDKMRGLLFPTSPASLAAHEVLALIGKIYQAVDNVVYGMATPAAAQAEVQKFIDAIASNDAAADAAAEEKP